MARRGTARRRGPGPVAPLAHGLAVVLLRLFAGGFFLATAWWKLVEEGFSLADKVAYFRDHEYVPVIENAIRHPPQVLGVELGAYTAFLAGVMLPAASVLAPLILFFEALLGVSLVLGFAVRLLASLGFLMMLAFTLAKPQPGAPEDAPVGVWLFTVRSANWPVTLLLLALALLAAGRVVGLDAWLLRRGPPWWRRLG